MRWLRNNQILNQMAVISGQNSFTTDEVGDCLEILSETPSPITSRRGELQSTPISTGACRKNITEELRKNNTTQLQRTITELQNAVLDLRLPLLNYRKHCSPFSPTWLHHQIQLESATDKEHSSKATRNLAVIAAQPDQTSRLGRNSAADKERSSQANCGRQVSQENHDCTNQ